MDICVCHICLTQILVDKDLRELVGEAKSRFRPASFIDSDTAQVFGNETADKFLDWETYTISDDGDIVDDGQKTPLGSGGYKYARIGGAE